MSKLQEVEEDKQTMDSVVQLTGAFEGIASVYISQIKEQVDRASLFFDQLWDLYENIRVNRDGSQTPVKAKKYGNKQLVVIVTSEGALSGDIDQILIENMLLEYNPKDQDLVVIGKHGAALLRDKGVEFDEAYKMPDRKEQFESSDLMQKIHQYNSAKAYYQSYVTLMFQDVKQVDIGKSITNRDKKQKPDRNVDINEQDYIFEPSVPYVVEHLEHAMMNVTLNQIVLSSKLAQQASRFKAMSSARTRAQEVSTDLTSTIHRVKRTIKDERTREVVNGLKNARKA